MAKAKKIKEVVVTPSNVAEVFAETKKAVESTKTSVVVSYRGNTRIYSKEIHGADFKKLAQDFAEKFNGTIA
jgi:hypothetical protein